MCLSPTLLINPLCKRILKSVQFNYHESKPKIYFKNRLIPYSDYISVEDICRNCGAYTDGNRITCDALTIHNLVDNTFFYYQGSQIPFFIEGKCGRCAVCMAEKVKEYRSRLLFEAADYPNILFFTLTYSPEHLPPNGLERSDVSAFFKRFRINLQRDLQTLHNIDYQKACDIISFRTFYVGEYGTKFHRPHYHGLIFLKRPLSYKYFHRFVRIFTKSWGFGITDIQVCKSVVASCKYVTKYLLKQQCNLHPADKKPCFVQGPVKDGGLGCSQLQKYAYILHNKNTNLCIPLNISGKVVYSKIPTNIINRLFPRFSYVFRHFDSYNCLAQICYNELKQKRQLPSHSLFIYKELFNEYVHHWKRTAYLTLGKRVIYNDSYFNLLLPHGKEICLEHIKRDMSYTTKHNLSRHNIQLVTEYVSSLDTITVYQLLKSCVLYLSAVPDYDDFISYISEKIHFVMDQFTFDFIKLSLSDKQSQLSTLYDNLFKTIDFNEKISYCS